MIGLPRLYRWIQRRPVSWRSRGVLSVLWTFADVESPRVYLQRDRLAALCGLDARNLRAVLADLESAGLIFRDDHAGTIRLALPADHELATEEAALWASALCDPDLQRDRARLEAHRAGGGSKRSGGEDRKDPGEDQSDPGGEDRNDPGGGGSKRSGARGSKRSGQLSTTSEVGHSTEAGEYSHTDLLRSGSTESNETDPDMPDQISLLPPETVEAAPDPWPDWRHVLERHADLARSLNTPDHPDRVQVPKPDRAPGGLRERVAELGRERVIAMVEAYAEVVRREPGQRVWFNRQVYSDTRWPVLCAIVKRGTASRDPRDAARTQRRMAGAQAVDTAPRARVVRLEDPDRGAP